MISTSQLKRHEIQHLELGRKKIPGITLLCFCRLSTEILWWRSSPECSAWSSHAWCTRRYVTMAKLSITSLACIFLTSFIKSCKDLLEPLPVPLGPVHHRTLFSQSSKNWGFWTECLQYLTLKCWVTKEVDWSDTPWWLPSVAFVELCRLTDRLHTRCLVLLSQLLSPGGWNWQVVLLNDKELVWKTSWCVVPDIVIHLLTQLGH